MAKNEQKVENLSFEEALKQLESIISKMESGEVELEKSIEYYEKGVALKKYCEKKLKEAELRVEKITIDDAGNAKTENFE